MEQLINYLLQFGNLNKQQIDLIKSKVIEKEIKKNQYYLEAGKVQREVIFLTEGIMRVCYYNNKGEEITKFFFEENRFIADVNSFYQGIPTTEYVQAIIDCPYIAFPKATMNELSMTIIEWDSIVAKITARALAKR